ncbi:alpha/beta hydrolase [Clostridium luticellarii]|uniref:Putative acetyl-hydrolase LipR n=1 Tax=Clostridium luticellarii TaxID=1691940 RepID=A0A2T0BLB9_9CLOT|nr:alpha/beta hydrolase [Clostridium luticellarii]PRR84659.1 putative acetyl-hydrolase LipR precursor [Clostridium luticellarii]
MRTENKQNEKKSDSRISVGFIIGTIILAAVHLLFWWIFEVTPLFYVVFIILFAAFIFIRVRFNPRRWKKLIAWILFIILLIGSTCLTRANTDVSIAGNALSGVIKTFSHYVTPNTSINVSQAEPYKFGSWKVPDGYTNTEISLDNARGYYLVNDGGNHDQIIYQIHGGAYIMNFSDTYNTTAMNYSKSYDNADVFSIDYRTAPDNLYPCALEDAIDGYHWILEQGYSADSIIVYGDSAGGGLALAMTMKLRDNGEELPRAIILSSPWADLTASGESYKTKIEADAIFGTRAGMPAPEYPVPITYAGDSDRTDPYISPVYGDFTGMPPMLIQVGCDELLLSDSVTVAEKAKSVGVDVTLIEYSGMFHTFYIIAPTIPEGVEAWNQIEIFISDLK